MAGYNTVCFGASLANCGLSILEKCRDRRDLINLVRIVQNEIDKVEYPNIFQAVNDSVEEPEIDCMREEMKLAVKQSSHEAPGNNTS